MSHSSSVVVLDYGFGNIRSAVRALEHVGATVTLTNDFQTAVEADGLVIPGVGAFAACMAGIESVNGAAMVDTRLIAGRPILGICVGMQIMFERGIEHNQDCAGLGQWPGSVVRLDAPVTPHMGWNTVEVASGSVLFDGIEHESFYFVHSYAARNWVMTETDPYQQSPLVSRCDYGGSFIAAVENGPLSAVQFHPEKSGEAGLRLLRNWVNTL
jgi:imidazole glycerol-phosphate synthase subunit HisH